MNQELPRTSNKVENTWALLRLLESCADGLSFKAVFAALLVSCRSVPEALERELKLRLRKDKTAEGKKLLASYVQWFAAKEKERQEDDSLLKFVEKARNEDVHGGIHHLVFPRAMINHAALSTSEGPPGTSSIVVNPDGVFYIVDADTAAERRIPVQGVDSTVEVHLATPLTHHLGKPVVQNDPISVATVAVNFYAEMLWEAGFKFIS